MPLPASCSCAGICDRIAFAVAVPNADRHDIDIIIGMWRSSYAHECSTSHRLTGGGALQHSLLPLVSPTAFAGVRLRDRDFDSISVDD